MEAPELQNISRIAELIKTQDFLTNIYEGVSECFPDLSFAMSHASVNSDIAKERSGKCPLQACSQKIMVGKDFLWSHLANHSPGAVNEFIFFDVCNPTFIRAILYIQNICIL